jgi:hypothetical protein
MSNDLYLIVSPPITDPSQKKNRGVEEYVSRVAGLQVEQKMREKSQLSPAL